MKKIIVLFIFVVALAFCGVAYAEDNDSTFILPSDLRIIEDEAFEGTSVETVILPDGFLFIGESAFGEVQTLKKVYIPESTIYIADSAFSDDASYTILGLEGSYAEDWAKEHNVPFEEEDIWRHVLHHSHRLDGNERKRDIILWTLDPFEPDRTEKDTQDDNKSYRVEDRPEFHPIDYRFP